MQNLFEQFNLFPDNSDQQQWETLMYEAFVTKTYQEDKQPANKDVYPIVTDTIIKQLEAGTVLSFDIQKSSCILNFINKSQY